MTLRALRSLPHTGVRMLHDELESTDRSTTVFVTGTLSLPVAGGVASMRFSLKEAEARLREASVTA